MDPLGVLLSFSTVGFYFLEISRRVPFKKSLLKISQI
jgi:hypothetical protein